MASTHISIQFGGVNFVLFGEILNIVSCKDKEEETWFALEQPPESFSDIVLADSMFVDHMPWHTEAGLHVICERMIEEERIEN